jgi:hypothetical protein
MVAFHLLLCHCLLHDLLYRCARHLRPRRLTPCCGDPAPRAWPLEPTARLRRTSVTPPRIGRSQRTRDKSRLLVGRRRHVHGVFVVADTISPGNSVRAPRFLVPSDCPHHSTQSDNYPFISIRGSTQTYQIEQIQIKMGGNTGVALISPFEHLHALN